MGETFDEITKRRQGFIRAWRANNLGSVVDDADADDMEWLLERIDTQIRETPPQTSRGIAFGADKGNMERLRHQRIFIAGVLGNKRTLEKRSMDTAATRANLSIFISGAAVLIALGAFLVALW